eukprot:CAMPEP_0183422814 /NCGR_PEP_ID=MMETSP0370-20130417/28046_1 /TAXON_ID=268820 /ORGANISM="Peridinium aciculiferum, Strain PAER-2" /LENGTH=460 /DNA_ID=CAMNT_0025606929 /DNA_START=81 /DNA_END=1463 /DNA_ORIENTATION=-
MSAMPQMQAAQGDATRSALAVGGPPSPSERGMLSTDVLHGLPVPRFLPPSPEAAELAWGGGSWQDRPYCPGELLRRSASFDAEVSDPASLPRLLGRCTQAAKGAICAAAVIEACGKVSRVQAPIEKKPRATVVVDVLPAAEVEEAEGKVAAVPADEAEEGEHFKLPELGSLGMPTVGSACHEAGLCKPCAFVFTSGCQSGIHCRFCHLCEQGEKKRRKKEKRDLKKLGLYPRRGAGNVQPDLGASAPLTTPPGVAMQTLAAEGARRAAAMIAASRPGDLQTNPEASCSNRSTADTDDLQVMSSSSSKGPKETLRPTGLLDEPRMSSSMASTGDFTGAPAWWSSVTLPFSSAPAAAGAAAAGAATEAGGATEAVAEGTGGGEATIGQVRPLKLEDALAAPKLGTPCLPTVGSAFHVLGTCKPCAFALTDRCQSGIDCKFCHLCAPGEKGRRQKERRQLLKI